ncbi:hypothetical protein ACB092_05G031600 [Castanea dentata]
MTHESTTSITTERTRRKNEKKKVGEKESWRFCYGLAHSSTPLYLSFFKVYIYLFFFYEIIFISFRCSFSTWVHLACRLLLSFLLFFFFFKKVLLVCFNFLYVVMLKLLCCC